MKMTRWGDPCWWRARRQSSFEQTGAEQGQNDATGVPSLEDSRKAIGLGKWRLAGAADSLHHAHQFEVIFKMDSARPSNHQEESSTSIGQSSCPGNAGPVVTMVDPTAEAGWDARLLSMPGSTFFHSAAWAAVLRDTYGFVPQYLTVVQDGVVQALLPLFEARSWLAGTRGVSLPFTDECGPIGSTPGHAALLVESALKEGARRRWRFAEFRGSDGFADSGRESQSFLGHRLRLNVPEGELWKGFADPVRRAIKKAERGGLVVEHHRTLEAMRVFYSLHGRTRRRHGLPPQPFRFFQNIHRHVLERDLGFVSVARQGGRPVAAAIFLHMGGKAIYKFGASDERLQHLRGNNSVMWGAIQHLVQRGCEELVFGRTSPGEEGLRRFKLGWGTEEYHIGYRRYDFASQCFVAARDQSSGWHTRVFGVLPVPVLRFLGERLYPHLV